jgi:hypothetical protein
MDLIEMYHEELVARGVQVRLEQLRITDEHQGGWWVLNDGTHSEDVCLDAYNAAVQRWFNEANK